MFINTIKIDLYSASKKQTNKQTPRQGSKQADVWTHVLQTVFRYGCRMEFVSSFSYRSIYRTHQFQFLSVAGLHTQHISSSSFLLPVYIPSTSVPVPFCCRSTYPAHQFPQSYCLAPQLCKTLRPFDTLGIERWGLGHVNNLSPCQ